MDFRKCRFAWDDDLSFAGFTDDTRWNGFLNVEVEPAVHAVVKEYFKEREGDAFVEADWDMSVNARGRISYAYGFATVEVFEGEDY